MLNNLLKSGKLNKLFNELDCLNTGWIPFYIFINTFIFYYQSNMFIKKRIDWERFMDGIEGIEINLKILLTVLGSLSIIF